MHERSLYIQRRSALCRGEGENDGVAPCCTLSPFTFITIVPCLLFLDPARRLFGRQVLYTHLILVKYCPGWAVVLFQFIIFSDPKNLSNYKVQVMQHRQKMNFLLCFQS
ncbi:TPA: hypothetical protein GDO54_018620 [Pyxicephalus adspersus]|uniref:Uncharacterized protein n=1 Tax=Pyxicephalus adspersus TaxID=30357 RepID=A0AAV2ZPI4_PYXAD|nr:TPA: hypothetical protein GDO54_018620 [Pyxicephalus adspersus]